MKLQNEDDSSSFYLPNKIPFSACRMKAKTAISTGKKDFSCRMMTAANFVGKSDCFFSTQNEGDNSCFNRQEGFLILKLQNEGSAATFVGK